MSTVFLTIDDVPQKVAVPIVDFLLEKGITPIMFAVGRDAEDKPDILQYILKKGIVVGNHSYTHPDFSSLTWEQCIEEIEKTEEILNRAYEQAGVERTYKLFRFPYLNKGGVHKEKLQKYLREHGFIKLDDSEVTNELYVALGNDKEVDVSCSYDVEEYNIRPGVKTMGYVLDKMRFSENSNIFTDEGKHIVLFHAHDATDAEEPEYYKTIIEYMLRHGVVFEKPKFN